MPKNVFIPTAYEASSTLRWNLVYVGARGFSPNLRTRPVMFLMDGEAELPPSLLARVRLLVLYRSAGQSGPRGKVDQSVYQVTDREPA